MEMYLNCGFLQLFADYRYFIVGYTLSTLYKSQVSCNTHVYLYNEIFHILGNMPCNFGDVCQKDTVRKDITPLS